MTQLAERAPLATAAAIGLRKRAVAYLRVSSAEQAQTNERDGYSIDVQRDMANRKADLLDADIEKWFVDPGRSAKNLNRPDLNRMRQYLRDNPGVDFVIVPWLDRLSRSTEDCAVLFMEFREAGARLVSCSESFDETPAGKFMRAIFAAKAEYDNNDRAERVAGGMLKKVQQGGTPTRASIGYRNEHRNLGGSNVAVVVLDKERAPHILWAYEAYATGEWTDATLWAALCERGLTSVPYPGRPLVPIARSMIGRILTNPYYTGVVPYKGVNYPGEHPAIVSRELFDKVQAVRASHNRAGDKRRIHHHHLKGTLFCACGSRLGVTPHKGNGGVYDYSYCIGRHKRGTCQQPYVEIDRFEAQVTEVYSRLRIDPTWQERVRDTLAADAATDAAKREREIARQERRLARITTERRNLARSLREAPRLAAEINAELDELDRQAKDAERIIATYHADAAKTAATFDRAASLVANIALVYRVLDHKERRLLNHFFFNRVVVEGERVVRVDYTDTARLILGHHDDPEGPETKNHGPSQDRGSNVFSLVEVRGFEPLTPCLPSKCSTS